ncbi:transglycosylase domain-containing protein [Nocardioides lianchengensis]|uniref:Membrane carboxypeptidase (Penicillin-binding protein) n=1 Tax=Nocardioides lianchengensis TaxID=1045774 RepID=A0A1G6LHN1_9ACTN|nr:transglycosylase domain-containing protein [Nocardioides lianchengensis]NYG12551.1 membrane peptidoglycan carboxypeptidase [Nocardioides lianchengensis]SDC42751.1 Membrane carboxypeptidase (penicillin-binding protein) [Nocardioides lianchengensis]
MNAKRRAAGPAQKKAKKAPKPPRTRKQKVLRVAKWFGIVGLVGTLLAVGSFVALYQAIDVPKPNEKFQDETTVVSYANGDKLGTFATQNRDIISFDEIPETLQNAVVAAENQSFWSDRGIDPKGILRAAFSNASGGSTQGASTITQQYVKILYLNQDRSYTRKVKEAILSLKIQRQQSKKEILTNYLNTIYFGRGAYGVEAAAQAYFRRPASKLNLRQSVVLARVLNNPTAYDPANGEDAATNLKAGYDFILDAMTRLDYVTADEAAKAKERLPKFPPVVKEDSYGGQRGHMLTMVKNELARLGYSEDEVVGKGLRVTTTLTKKDMDAAQAGVKEARPEGFSDKNLHVGVASVEPGTGAIRGFYGGQDYLKSQLNWAVAGGQAGSILKPFALAAGIKAGFSLKDTFEGNSPFTVGDTDFNNQGFRDYGRVNLIKATQDSINTAFIDLTDSIPNGPAKIIKMMNAMGIPPEKAPSTRSPGFPNKTPGLEPGVGVALGSATVSPINMATAYATIANKGVYAEPYLIEKIVDRDGKEVYTHRVKDKRVLDEDIAADVSYAMQQVVKAGSGTAALALDRPAAGKTGTSTNDDDHVVSSWFSGFTPQLATSVVYTRGKGAEPLDGWLPNFFGGTFPAQTWTEVMTRALEGEDVLDLPDAVYVDGDAPDTGHAPYTPPPSPTKKPTKKPSDKPTRQPTRNPSTAPPTTSAPPPTTSAPPPTPTNPTPSCGGLLPPCETPTPTDEPTPTDDPSAAGRRR